MIRHHTDGERVIYLVEEQPNPSTDYFVLPAMSARACRVERRSFADLPDPAEMDGAAVVFVRYVPQAWARLVEAARPKLQFLALFIDDDVLDPAASAGMPWRYRIKLARLAAWQSGWLKRQGAELWVSTPHLLRKYAEWNPRLVLPTPVESPLDVCRVFYHGSASHKAEIRWLRRVMGEVLRSEERISFEISGGNDVYKLYRDLPRVHVVHPMKWPAYRHFVSMPGRHVGLAPLLNSPFNAARSYTKFFDFTRQGAVGIYSPASACAEVVRHGVSGLIVESEQDAWVSAILTLARDAPLRQSLLRNAEATSAELANVALRSYSSLLQQREEN